MKLVTLTLHVTRTVPIDDDLLKKVPKVNDLTDIQLINLCKEIWVEHMPEDIIDHIHGEITYHTEDLRDG